MKLLTAEQLTRLLKWDYIAADSMPDDISYYTKTLIEAECRAHGYAGIEDAYKHLIEKEGK